MGICDNIHPGTCDVIFVLFMIELATVGLSCICLCAVGCISIYFASVDEVKPLKDDTRNGLLDATRIFEEEQAKV
jgi:hypothetical protein